MILKLQSVIKLFWSAMEFGYRLRTTRLEADLFWLYPAMGVEAMAKTARDLDPEELRSYHPWRTLEHYAMDAEVDKRWHRAWEIARRAAELLKDKFGATKIVVFGSLVHRTWFTPWSDVDLAAWGIPVEKFYRAVGTIYDLGAEAGFKIDVIDPNECNRGLVQNIHAEGIEL